MRFPAMDFDLETDRLSLRLRDGDDAVWNRELLVEQHPGIAVLEADLRRRMAEQHTQSLDSGIGLLAMRRRSDDEPVGYCGLVVGRYSLDEPELACEVLPRFRRCGYATEAARAVADAALSTGRTRIWATIGMWNIASLKVVERIGFRRDHVAVDGGADVAHMVLEAAGASSLGPRP